jgi:hypothetical protein
MDRRGDEGAAGETCQRIGDGAYRRCSIVLVLVVDCFPHEQTDPRTILYRNPRLIGSDERSKSSTITIEEAKPPN